MQKCKECGASWDIGHKLDVCPFCGADLREKASADSIESAFKIILERHGQEVFQSSKLLGLLADYAPSLIAERRLVKDAIECGAYRAICTAPVAERGRVLNRYVSFLADSYNIDEIKAREALMWCVNALDADSHIEIEASRPDVELRLNGSESSIVDVSAAQTYNPIQREVVDPDLIISDGVLEKYRGAKRSLRLPTSIHTIAETAFQMNSHLFEIIIPGSVKEIEKSAFSLCMNLEEVIIENGVRKIRGWAFAHCYQLKRIIVPNTVISIGKYAFKSCESLETAQLSDKMKKIQEGTFYGCGSLKSVVIPDSVKHVGVDAFAGCALLDKESSDHLHKFRGYRSWCPSPFILSDKEVHEDW